MFRYLKSRSVNDKIRIVTSIVLLVSALVFFIIDLATIKNLEGLTKPDRSYLTLLLLAIAAVMNVVPVFVKKLSPLVLVTILLISFGIGVHLYLLCFAYADLGTNVPFFTNSMASASHISMVYTIFLAIFLLCELVCVFLAFRKD